MDHFPSAAETVAASALLLLSSQFRSSVVEEKKQAIGAKSDQSAVVDSLLSCHLKSSSSPASMIADDGSSEEVERRRLKISTSSVAGHREIRLKVARRNRSKRYFICNIKHNGSMAKTATASSESAQNAVSEASCLSVSSEPRHEEITLNKEKKVGSGHLWRRAEAILGFLKFGGCASEVRIRQVLGDTPDTSKALRILLKQEEIGRSGGGGRSDPYIYNVILYFIQSESVK